MKKSEKIGDRIKSIREKIGMSQTELARKINSTKQTVYKYENNIITNIPVNKVEAIASALQTTPEHLMGWDNDYYRTDDEVTGLNGLTSILEYLYDNIQFKEFPAAYDHDTFEIMLTSEETTFTLSEMQYDLLFNHVCSSILNYIKLIQETNNPSKSTANTQYLNAAHARTDIKRTPDGQMHDDAIMDDDSEWE